MSSLSLNRLPKRLRRFADSSQLRVALLVGQVFDASEYQDTGPSRVRSDRCTFHWRLRRCRQHALISSFAVMFGGAEHYLTSRQISAKQENGYRRAVARIVQPLSAV